MHIVCRIANPKLSAVLIHTRLNKIERLIGRNNIGTQTTSHCCGKWIEILVNKLIVDAHLVLHELFIGHRIEPLSPIFALLWLTIKLHPNQIIFCFVV